MSIVYIAVILFAILFEGFFSGAEIAIISLNRIRLRILAEARDKRAVVMHKLLSKPDRLLGTTLVGTNLAVVIASSVCTKLIYDIYGSSSELLTTAILTPVILIFGEFIPKTVFSHSGIGITFYLGFILQFFMRIFAPIVWVIAKIVNFILSVIFRQKETKKSPFVTKEEIKYLIKESENEGEINPYERNVIYKIFDFGKKHVKDVQKGLDALVFVTPSDTIEDVLKKARGSGYSRFPIRSGDNFAGIINILDIVYEQDKTKSVMDFVRPLEYVHSNMDIDNALLLLQSKKQTLSIVKDSSGNPEGFFTMEDLLEEIVGEI